MSISGTISALVTVLISVFIYSRSSVLYTFYANAPSSLKRVNELLSPLEVRFAGRVRNCEDVFVNDADGWALLSCDPSRDTWNTVMGTFVDPRVSDGTGIYLYDYGSDVESLPVRIQLEGAGPTHDTERNFHPLGVEYEPESRTLFVVNHGFDGPSIEIYELDVQGATATHVRSLKHSGIRAPNSIVALSSDEFFVTNDHQFLVREQPLLAKLETYTGFAGGSVSHVKLAGSGEPVVNCLASVSFANGIALLNASTLAVASSSAATVFLYSVETSGTVPKLQLAKSISVPFIPDNLSVDSDGKLLIAGHPHAPSLEQVAKNNRFCNTPADSTEPDCQLHRLSWIADWSAQDGLKTLYAGDDFGTSTTAVRDTKRGVGIAVGLYERGILVWKA